MKALTPRRVLPILVIFSAFAFPIFGKTAPRKGLDETAGRTDGPCKADGSDRQLAIQGQSDRYAYVTAGCPRWDWTSQTTPNEAGNSEKVYYIPKFPQQGNGIDPIWVGDYGGEGHIMGPIGITLDGTAIFSNLALEGANAVETESDTLDECLGHPTMTGIYHHHSATPCLDNAFGFDENGHSKLQGYALDGYGIYGGVNIGPISLDKCQGHNHSLPDVGYIYHYHLTYQNPYSLMCLRGCVASGNNFRIQNCACKTVNDCTTPAEECVDVKCGQDGYCHYTAVPDRKPCTDGECQDGECVTSESRTFGGYTHTNYNPDDAGFGAKPPSVFTSGSVGFGDPKPSYDFTTPTFGFNGGLRWNVIGLSFGTVFTLTALAMIRRRRRYNVVAYGG